MKKTPSETKTLKSACGQRLRKFREHHIISAAAMSRELHCGTSIYEAYEAGRAPLKMAVFLALYEKFNLSARWLFTGKGSAESETFLLEKVRDQIDPKEKFSDFWTRAIAPLYDGHHDRAELGRAGAVKLLKAFLAEAEAGRMGAMAVLSVAELAVDKWPLKPGGKRPPRLAFHATDLHDERAAALDARHAAVLAS